METLTLRDEIAARRELGPPVLRRATREASGISLESIARELGVTRQAVGHWEAGRRFPRGRLLVEYARVLRLLREENEAQRGDEPVLAGSLADSAGVGGGDDQE